MAATGTWVWIDGKVTLAGLATVDATDRGFQLGDGVFETVRVEGARAFALGRHLARLRTGAARLGIDLPWDDATIRTACEKTIAAASGPATDQRRADDPLLRLRITVSGGVGSVHAARADLIPTLAISVTPADPSGAIADVVTMEHGINEHSPIAGVKTTSRADHLARRALAHERGASEAVLANTAGVLCEGTASNVFVTVGGRLCTPSLGTGCLAGVTRGLVCELVEAVERDDLTLDHLRNAPEAFLTSTMRGITPIAGVDGHPLRTAPGPLTEAAVAALTALQARTSEP